MTHAALIDKLGDGNAVAALLFEKSGKKISRDAVYKWKANGIPWRWQPFFAKICKDRGWRVPKDFVAGLAA